jgi:hypothetical protein
LGNEAGDALDQGTFKRLSFNSTMISAAFAFRTCVSIEVGCFVAIFGYYKTTKTAYLYFNPSDYWASVERNAGNANILPIKSKDATFEPMMTQYFGLAKLLITLAAASISFSALAGTRTRSTPQKSFWHSASPMRLCFV